jgi:FKBP-type peptidyl-prolyl cis-trans isomerase
MNRLTKTVSGFALALIIALSGCSDDPDTFDPAAQLNQEVGEIDDYLDGNQIAHIKDLSGVRIVPTALGNHLPAQALSQIDVDYKGTLFSTGEQFEEGTAKGFLTNFIPGWQIALSKLPVGSIATVYIPSYYAYGKTGSTKIPSNSTLVFELNIKSATQSSLYEEQFISDTTKLNNYISSKGLTVTKDLTGVRYMSMVEGTGQTPSWFNTVKIKYTFTLVANDTKVVGPYDREPTPTFASFVVDYIQGVQVGLMKMKEGGKMRLFVPSGMAFGIENATDGAGNVLIPGNSNVIIDLELIEVN